MIRGLLAGATNGAAVAGLVLGLPAPASAHSASDYFKHRFTASSVYFYFDLDFPANSPFPIRDRVIEGLGNWPTWTGRPSVTFAGNSVNGGGWRAPCSSPYPVANGLHWFGIDGANNTLAETSLCFDGSGNIINGTSHIAFDSAESWWAYDNATWGGYYDLEGVATHEFGHALGGWTSDSNGHWKASDDLCTGGAPHTMCPTMNTGSDYWRTTEYHDNETMDLKY